VVTSEFAVDPGVDADGFERSIHSLAGRFAAVWLGRGGTRVFLDASGSLGVVYCAEQEIAASTAFLVPYQDASDDRLALVNEPTPYPYDPHLYFGLTVRHSVDWLLPNHYLDLESWRTVRYWPIGESESTDDVEDVLETVVNRVRESVRALVESGPVQMSLTAGNDTRALLACSKEFLDEIEFVTLAFPDRIGRTDVNVARQMASALGLRHRVIRGRASFEDIDRVLYRTGCVAALDSRCQQGARMMANLDSKRPYLSASMAEVARQPSYRTWDPEPQPQDIERLLAWENQPAWPELIERGRRWLDDLPVRSAAGIIDFVDFEQRYGGWTGYLPYAYPEGSACTVYPFSDWRVFEAVLRLPFEYRLGNRFTPDIVVREWPELAAFPINQARVGWYGTYRRLRTLAKQALHRRLA